MAGYDQRQMSKGGDQAPIRGFKSAALNKNKKLGQYTLQHRSLYVLVTYFISSHFKKKR